MEQLRPNSAPSIPSRILGLCLAVLVLSFPSAGAAAAISISPSSASVPVGDTQQFTATADPAGPIAWKLEIIYFTGCPRHCVEHITSCSGCGTVSPTDTQSGVPTTYTAPSTPYHPPNGASKLLVVASQGALSATADITIPPIQVSASPNPAKVPLAMTQQVIASVVNDGTNQGVTWSVQQNGVPCSPTCGTISPTRTASGQPATYTAPGVSPVLPVVSVVATSVNDSTKSGSSTQILTTASGRLICSAGSGKESLLTGQYAFLLQAFGPLSYPSGGVFFAGSITANGNGRITGGEEDIGFPSGAGHVPPTISTTASLYSVGPDYRGCLLLAGTDGETQFLRFGLGSVNASGTATTGELIEFDDTTGAGTRGAGLLRLQDPTSFEASHFKGNYAFGTVGQTPTLPGTAIIGSVGIVGTFQSDGVSAISATDIDLNLGGSVSNAQSAGTFQCCDGNGRGGGQFTDLYVPTSFLLYQINSTEALFLTGNDLWGTAGKAIAISSGTNFSESSLNGAAVLRDTAQSATGPVVDIATVSADGLGNLTTNDNVNSAGVFATSSTSLTYQVASNGRVTLAGTSTPPVLYLYGPNQGFLMGTDANVTFGILEPQTGSPFSDSSFSGAYTLGTENPSSATVTMESGALTANGEGSTSGAFDQSSSAGLAANQGLNISYSISAKGAGNVGSGTTAVVISGKKLAFINDTDPNPAVFVVEK